MRRILQAIALAALASLLKTPPVDAQVKYDQGRRMVRGVQLLQDYRDSLAYYYLPQYPRLARKDDGTFELLCLKYVGEDGESSGGLLHALFEFDLPDDLLDSVRVDLEQEVSGARLVGPVPLLSATEEEDGEQGVGSFRVISSVVREGDDGGLARSLLTSGRAPLMPGSRAVVASLLEPEGATLLWNSLTGPTSDVSVSVRAYYEAAVEAYNARVDANIDMVYEHFDSLSNVQGLPTGEAGPRRSGASPGGVAAAAAAGGAVAGPGGAAVAAGVTAASGSREQDRGLFSRDFVSTVVDSLVRNGIIEIAVLDRSEALDVDAAGMDGLLSLITDKLVELMFDATTGWSQNPPRERALAFEDVGGRQPEGFLGKVFGNAMLNALPGVDTNQPYYSDDLYVLKNRTDIRRNHFSVLLSRSTTVKVPVDASGNLGGLYDALDADPRYFRVVNLDDPAFQFRDVHFQVDRDFVSAFADMINFVSVTARKRYEDNPEDWREFVISQDDVEQGTVIRQISFPRLGETDPDWHEYEYRQEWSLRGGPTLQVPADGGWSRGTTAAVSLRPPLEKEVVEIDADRDAFERNGVVTAVVRFATTLAGEVGKQREVRLRVDDVEPTETVVLYHDPGEAVAYQIDWYTSGSDPVSEPIAELTSDYLFLSPTAATLSMGGEGGP